MLRTKKPETKILIIYLEGVLVNFSEKVIGIKTEDEAQRKMGGEPTTSKTKNECHHVFVPVASSPAKGSKSQVFEVITRPYARMFLQVCSTRFEIYLVHNHSDHVARYN